MITGEELRKLITEYGWSQKSLAEHMGIHPDTICKAVKSSKIPSWKARAYIYAMSNTHLERFTEETLTRWKGTIEDLGKMVGLSPTNTKRIIEGKMKLSNFRSYSFLYAITKAEGQHYDY